MLSAVWAHLLAADEEQRGAVATVSLFAGPERLPSLHPVLLGRFRSPLVVPHAQCAHAYIYYDSGTDNEGFAGRVVAKSVTRLR